MMFPSIFPVGSIRPRNSRRYTSYCWFTNSLFFTQNGSALGAPPLPTTNIELNLFICIS
jgi:hypothetical protein